MITLLYIKIYPADGTKPLTKSITKGFNRNMQDNLLYYNLTQIYYITFIITAFQIFICQLQIVFLQIVSGHENIFELNLYWKVEFFQTFAALKSNSDSDSTRDRHILQDLLHKASNVNVPHAKTRIITHRQ